MPLLNRIPALHVPTVTVTVTCPYRHDKNSLSANCDDGWTYLGKTASCYKTFFGPGNYSYSEGVCQNNRAHLVSIHSDAENEFVIDLSSTGNQQSSSYQVWIGLYLNLGRWSWSDGSPTDYIVWTSGSPFGSYDSGFVRIYFWIPEK